MATTTTYVIPPLAPSTPLTSDGVAPSAQFQQYWLKAIATIQSALNGIQGQETATSDLVAQLQTVQDQQTAQIALINQALIIANTANQSANPTDSQQQTAAGSVDLNTLNAWQNGPVVTFSSPRAATVTYSGSMISSSGNSTGTATMTGNARLQQIIGGAETTIATASFTIVPPMSVGGGHITPPSITMANWAPTSISDTLTSPVSYRMDLERTGGSTSAGVGIVTSVMRT